MPLHSTSGTFPRYPMLIEFDLTDGDFEAIKFVTADGVQETLTKPNLRRSFIIRNGMEFSDGTILPSGQGGKYNGYLAVQDFDNAKYPYNQAFFNPEVLADWGNLYAETWVELSQGWWTSLELTSPNCPGGIGVVAQKAITITLTDGSGYRTKHTVYLDMYCPAPV
jgi:hypothetical protein